MRRLLLIVALIGLTAAVSVTENSAYKGAIRIAGATTAATSIMVYKISDKKKKP